MKQLFRLNNIMYMYTIYVYILSIFALTFWRCSFINLRSPSFLVFAFCSNAFVFNINHANTRIIPNNYILSLRGRPASNNDKFNRGPCPRRPSFGIRTRLTLEPDTTTLKPIRPILVVVGGSYGNILTVKG